MQQVLQNSSTHTSQAAHEQVQQESQHPTTPASQAVQEQMQRDPQDSSNLEANNQSEKQELSSFLGTLARNEIFCPVNVFDWRKLKTHDDMWNYIKAKMERIETQESEDGSQSSIDAFVVVMRPDYLGLKLDPNMLRSLSVRSPREEASIQLTNRPSAGSNNQGIINEEREEERNEDLDLA
ncbi:hypothetical protein HAX54_028519 [Datura stramonium]|uniref:Uncharacterized protein n=1 Tax=Datura stramonium TaxID=4076 RepID=A0ABS8V491_DATST|nr:hypothetical protein [Datura stramonium]